MEVWRMDRLSIYAARRAAVTEEQIERTARLLEQTGWYMPIMVDPFGSVLDGTVLYLAAARLGYERVPVVVIGFEEGG
jgi:ParB-like chromosome segregation protein Spo0J